MTAGDLDPCPSDGPGSATVNSPVDALVARARANISMIDARRAAALWSEGALLVDIRPALQRRHFGEIPTALTIERNVLEWRLEPDGAHRHPRVAAHDGPIIVFCQEGHASSLAVMSLVDVGVPDVHDLAGGFRAWAEAHLPTDHPFLDAP